MNNKLKRIKIKELLKGDKKGTRVNVKGWVRTFRSNRFISLNDGSTLANLQAVIDFEKTEESILKKITTGACVSISGTLVESLGKGFDGSEHGPSQWWNKII